MEPAGTLPKKVPRYAWFLAFSRRVRPISLSRGPSGSLRFLAKARAWRRPRSDISLSPKRSRSGIAGIGPRGVTWFSARAYMTRVRIRRAWSRHQSDVRAHWAVPAMPGPWTASRRRTRLPCPGRPSAARFRAVSRRSRPLGDTEATPGRPDAGVTRGISGTVSTIGMWSSSDTIFMIWTIIRSSDRLWPCRSAVNAPAEPPCQTCGPIMRTISDMSVEMAWSSAWTVSTSIFPATIRGVPLIPVPPQVAHGYDRVNGRVDPP